MATLRDWFLVCSWATFSLPFACWHFFTTDNLTLVGFHVSRRLEGGVMFTITLLLDFVTATKHTSVTSLLCMPVSLINQACSGPYWENIGPRSWQYEKRPRADILPVWSRASLVNKRFITRLILKKAFEGFSQILYKILQDYVQDKKEPILTEGLWCVHDTADKTVFRLVSQRKKKRIIPSCCFEL